MTSVPRRARPDLMCPAELAIRDARIKVTLLGQEPSLARVISLLDQAQQLVSDYVDDRVMERAGERQRRADALRPGAEGSVPMVRQTNGQRKGKLAS